ncbi:unnamed protein product, partial [Heterosigma akashiwo]
RTTRSLDCTDCSSRPRQGTHRLDSQTLPQRETQLLETVWLPANGQPGLVTAGLGRHRWKASIMVL